jgi:ankyrin repeat protein
MPCKEGEVKDRLTKKCRPKLKPGRKSVACPPSQIRDKVTKKCRDKLRPGRRQVIRVAASIVNPTKDLVAQTKAAGEKGSVEIKKLLPQGADINVKDSTGKTPLMMLAEQGNLEMIKLFVLNGANLKDLTHQNESVLHFATEKSFPLLLSYDVPVNQVSNTHKTALHHAIDLNSEKSIVALLQHHATIQPFDDDYPNAIQYAMEASMKLKDSHLLRAMFPYLSQLELHNAYTEAMYWADVENNYLANERKEYNHFAKLIKAHHNKRFHTKQL